ncbi:DNA-binding response regulator [Kushneria pakistanensis]|uniref:DNA-binding response regulator n=1 Tax=Kushneria pakistanensis TaxID=1508770 RepID=A0ABQ3FQM6_9GAMM|nr:response regulator transcription factor [Kushneria pakistanensis]GHC32940.1 DNA-binding response regulator [Kushneria pakistanensis]
MGDLLLVEDDTPLAELIAAYLGQHGYRVHTTARGDTACEHVRRLKPVLVILDVMLPGMDGLRVCQQLRRDYPGLPILMLTARDDTHDQVLGLEMGADDYIPKPCEPRLLLARIRTLLRRSTPPETVPDDRIVIGQLHIDTSERLVHWQGREIDMSSAEFNVLVALARHAGEVQSRDQLLQQVRGIEFNGVDRTVDVAISKLRRRFEDAGNDPRRIKTVWGRGYLMSRTEWEV